MATRKTSGIALPLLVSIIWRDLVAEKTQRPLRAQRWFNKASVVAETADIPISKRERGLWFPLLRIFEFASSRFKAALIYSFEHFIL